MTAYKSLSCRLEALCPTGARWGIRCGAFFLFFLLAALPRPAVAGVFCYLEDLDIVQQTLAQDCKGRIVSPLEARAVEQRRQAYLHRVLEN